MIRLRDNGITSMGIGKTSHVTGLIHISIWKVTI